MSVLPIVAAASLLAPLAYWGALGAVNGRRRSGEPPLVRGKLPFLGMALPFGRDATGVLRECQARHGDVFTLYIGGQRMTFVVDPLSYVAVLKAKQLSFRPIADAVTEAAFQIPDLRERVDLETVEHLGKSELKGEGLVAMTASMAGRLRAVFDALPAGGLSAPVPLYRLVWDTMFEAGTDAVFGTGLYSRARAEDFETFDRAFPLMVANLPRFLVREGDAALARLASGPQVGEGPSKWIREREARLGAIAGEEHGRLQTSVLWAVNANTIPASFWSLYYLLRDPEALAAIRAEVESIAGEGELPVAYEDLAGLRLLDSAIREALRLSSGSLTVREALADFVLETRGGRFEIRAGDRVVLAPIVTHYDPEIFAEPERYRHDRFYIASGVKQFHKRGERVPMPLMPFGAGVSMCPGRFFAINEMKLFVAMALLSFDFELPAHETPAFDSSRAGLGIYPPVDEVMVRLRRRGA